MPYGKKHYKQKRTEWSRNYHKRKGPEYGKNLTLKRRFGITLEQYNKMLEEQNGLCAICHKPEFQTDPRTNKIKSLAVDHCHLTGRVRGLLCANCNHGLGKFKDNQDILRNAIVYLDAKGTK